MIFNEQQFTIKKKEKVFEVAMGFFYTDSSYENAVHPCFFYEQQFSKIKNLCLIWWIDGFLYRFLLWEAVGQKRKWAAGVLIFDRSPWRRHGHQFHSLQDRCKCHPHHSLISRHSHSYANYHSFLMKSKTGH